MCTQIFHILCLFGSAHPQINIICLYYLSGLPYLMMSREKKSQDKIRDNRFLFHFIFCQRETKNTLEYAHGTMFFCALHDRFV